jgi:eukaryotic-like serine/threonine-protein kinase
MGASADRRLVAGRYVLGGPLGRGGMGTVWRADDVLLGRPVAVKEVELPAGPAGEGREALWQRALREARAAARLNHPGVVTLHDAVEAEDRLFLVMELVEAPTLRDLVDRSGPVGPATAARVGLDLVEALDAAHRAGIVHHDVKPANVMVVPGGRVKLTDFGIASLQEDTQRTLTGAAGALDRGRAGAGEGGGGPGADRSVTAVFGSLPYVAPEQASGQAGPAADLWALGATLWFAVEGRPPFERSGPAATLNAILHDPPGRPTRAGPLAPVLTALLVKDPARRPAAAALRRMLEVAASGTAQPTVPVAGVPDRTATGGPPAPAVPPASGPTVPVAGAPGPTPPAAAAPRRPRSPAATARLPGPAAATEALDDPAPPPGWGERPPTPARRRRPARQQLPGWTAPPKRRRWGRRLLVAAGVLLLLAVASNLGDDRQGAIATPGLGDPVRDGQFQFVVRSVDCGAREVGEGIGRKPARDQFCLVALRVRNIGREGRTFGGGQQFLFDSDGKRHNPDLDATYRHGDGQLLSTHLNPGQRLEGTLVYDVPDPIVLDRVELHDAAFSGGVRVELG